MSGTRRMLTLGVGMLVVLTAVGTARADRVVADVTGSYGNLPLSASISVDMSADGNFAQFRVTNTTPASSGSPYNNPGTGMSPYVAGIGLNLGRFQGESCSIYVDQASIDPGQVDVGWTFTDSTGGPPGGADHFVEGVGPFMYMITADNEYSWNGRDMTLNLDLKSCTGNFVADAFINAPTTAGGAQVAVLFTRIADCGNYDGVGTGSFGSAPVPEPATLALMGIGTCAVIGVRRLRRRRQCR